MRPVFSSQLSDITPRLRPERIIDISDSALVPAEELREKLRMLQTAGELDGGLPIVRSGILVGLIPAPDLEFALDNLQSEEDEMCLMAPKDDYSDNSSDDSVKDPTDFSPYIDPVCSLNLSPTFRALIDVCGYRHLWHWRDIHPWSWFTNVSQSWVCDTCVFSGMDSLQEL